MSPLTVRRLAIYFSFLPLPELGAKVWVPPLPEWVSGVYSSRHCREGRWWVGSAAASHACILVKCKMAALMLRISHSNLHSAHGMTVLRL